MSTAATAQTNGSHGWMRTAFMTVGIALLGLTLMPLAARAATSQEIRDSAEFQVLLCEAGGGTAEVDVDRTVEGVRSSTVVCHGGVFDGMNSYNGPGGTICHDAHPHPVPFEPGAPAWQVDEILPVLESGSVVQKNGVLAALEASSADGQEASPPADEPGPAAGLGSASPDDQHQDQHHGTGKGKQGKHGKQGGKGGRK